MVWLSHPYMTTRKTIALTRWTFVGKVMSLLFNMLSGLIIAFLPRNSCLLISRLQSTIWSDFGAWENKVYHCFHCFPIYLPWSDGTGCHDLSFLNVEGFFLIFIFIYLASQGLSCGMRDLVPQPGIKPRAPALRAQSLSHWPPGESWMLSCKPAF